MMASSGYHPTRGQPLIVSWGELVWDELERPEGVLATLGGGACASAAHAAALGACPRLVSAVGDDAQGAQALDALRARGLSVEWIQTRENARTARVRVSFTSGDGPHYAALERLDWKSIDFAAPLESALASADALMLGFFMQGSEAPLDALRCALGKAGRPRVVGCDLNLRRAVKLSSLMALGELVDFVKLNQVELERATETVGADPIRFFLEREAGPRWVIETRGAAGARLTSREGRVDVPAPALDVIGDAVGAGDALMAAFVHELLQGRTPSSSLTSAVAYATSHVAQRGALPAFPGSPPNASS